MLISNSNTAQLPIWRVDPKLILLRNSTGLECQIRALLRDLIVWQPDLNNTFDEMGYKLVSPESPPSSTNLHCTHR